MFRLIAITLTSTFLLLALFGTSSEEVPGPRGVRAMGMMGALGSEVAVKQAQVDGTRISYVSRHHQPLKAAPQPGAMILRVLPYGAEVEVIDAETGKFAHVRDLTGDVGYLPADSLSDMFPD